MDRRVLGEPSPKYDEITVRGTRRLLLGLRDLDFTVEQFQFSSTMLVHRAGEPGQFISEDWPLAPTWAYPESKVRTEQLIRTARGDIPAVCLRIAGVYDDGCHSIPLAHQIQRIYARRFTSRVAKAGAWVMGKLPGADPFIRPWMIDRANDHYALDITRARQLLGWQPKRARRETLPKMVAALKADPHGFYRENGLELPANARNADGKWPHDRAGV